MDESRRNDTTNARPGVSGRKLRGRDLNRHQWRELSLVRATVPHRRRGAFISAIVEQTGLSPATVQRRLQGQFPGRRRPRAPMYRGMTPEQLSALERAVKRTRGLTTGQRLWSETLGSPDKPSVRTVRRWLAAWRREKFAQRQLALPLGAQRATSVSASDRRERRRNTMDALVRAAKGW